MYKAGLSLLKHSPLARGVSRIVHREDSSGLSKEVMDLQFRNPVGVAASFDTLADYRSAFSALACSFELIGPLSYGEKNGIRASVNGLQRRSAASIPVGIIITKAPGSTTEDEIQRDYLNAFEYAYDFADMLILDFSDENLGSIHELDFIQGITDPVLNTRLSYETVRPVLLRLSRLLGREELEPILDYCLMNGVDGIVATGGTRQVAAINEFTKGRYPVIALSAVRNAAKANELFAAGASLIALDASSGRFRHSLPQKILKSLKIK